MTTKYYALLTNQGAAKLANATALGTKLQITEMAVGDGGGVLPTPDASQTKLIGEKRRAALNSLSIDAANSSQIIAEQIIPENEGGFWIREIGLFDADGVMIAVANCAETYKPQLQEGSGRTQTVRMIIIVNSASAVTLKIDPSVVLATRQYVDDGVIEAKQYADKGLADHVAAANPHKQYLQIANALAEIKSAGKVAELLANLGLTDKFTGRLLRTIVMSTSGSYTPGTDAKKVMCKLVGAGASGASGVTVDVNTFTSSGGGGGGGGYVEFEVDLSQTSITNIPITIGLGGASVTGSSGYVGGTTYFGSKIYASGGGSGAISTRLHDEYEKGLNPVMVIPGGAGSGFFSETTQGYRLIRKANGETGGWGYLGASGQLGGAGGASALSGNAYYAGNEDNGHSGTEAGYGAGGSGSCCYYDTQTPKQRAYTAKPSGSGANGVVIIYEYA